MIHAGETVLVTGAGGLIGLEVVKTLLGQGYSVVAVDNFTNSSLNDFPEHAELRLYVKDIRNRYGMNNIFRLHPNISSVIHLAALHYIPYCDSNPHETFEVNVLGTQNLLDVMVKHGVERILFSSTAAVYMPSSKPHKELSRIGPVDIYGDTKYMCEQLLKFYADNQCIKYTILRLFNVYGYGDSNPHLIPSLLDQILQTNMIHVGNPSSLRDYISKHDVAKSFKAALENPKAINRVYNVGHEVPYSAKDIFDMLAELLRRYHNKEISLKINHQDRIRRVDRPLLVSDTTKIRSELAWKPEFSIYSFFENWVEEEYVRTR